MNTERFTEKQKRRYCLFVILTLPLGGMSTDVYMPSLPHISQYFSTTQAYTQLTVTVFIIAMAFAQLIAGPISDSFGRKKLLIASTSLQIIFVLGIIFSPTILSMLVFRFFQGLACAFMMVPARAIVTDIYTGEKLKKMIGTTSIFFALSPIIAPFIGGYLQHFFGWHSNFMFLLIYIALVFTLTLLRYQETISQKHPFVLSKLWHNYHRILRNKKFIRSSLFTSIVLGYFAMFVVTGPFLVQVTLKYSAIVYGHMALFLGVAWFLGTSLARLAFRYDIHLKTQIALIATLLISIMMLIKGYHVFNLWTLMIPTITLTILSGFKFPTYMAESLTIFPDIAASANGCLFSMTWLVFGAYTYAASFFNISTLIPISISYIVVSLLAIILYFGFLKKEI